MTYQPSYAGIDYVNASDYGVTGDGSDQTQSWLSAWEASKNKRLVLPAGKIIFSEKLSLDPSCSYFAEGQGAGADKESGTYALYIGNDNAIECDDSEEKGRDNFRWFNGWRLDGTRNSKNGFYFNKSFGFRMRNMFVSEHGFSGVYGKSAYSSVIENSVFSHNGGHGVCFYRHANNIKLHGVKSFNSSRNGGGFSNILIGSDSHVNANLQIIVQNCDWSASGISKWSGGVDGEAVGLTLQYCYSSNIVGNYAEIAPNFLTYIASNCKGVKFEANYMQDGHVLIEEGCRGVFSSANVMNQQNQDSLTSFRAASGQYKSSLYNCVFNAPELLNGALNISL